MEAIIVITEKSNSYKHEKIVDVESKGEREKRGIFRSKNSPSPLMFPNSHFITSALHTHKVTTQC
jgi:hypothetical protein